MVSPGPLTTIQDRGRFGFGQYGVPPSGALDTFSLRVGNLLVGNEEGDACLEITLMGLVVRALEDLVVAATGADLAPRVNGEAVQMWQSRLMRKGDRLSFKGPKSGCRAYLAVAGGIRVPLVMGSRSTNLSARFGGFEGRPLQRGDVLASASPHLHLRSVGRSLSLDFIPKYPSDSVIRILPGPNDDHFSAGSWDSFLACSYQVTGHADRTGIRLAGASIDTRADMRESILSEGVVPGAIQVPGDGQPIIILNETVTGGYRKIATVISADLPLLGQLKPGDAVRFVEISIQEAITAFRSMEDMIAGLKD
ncbi:MAG TPA: biotin-dependent carboxyltransferase [Deltaproteobacteria bacterium]|nr:biotin-dependent carboxyltransferase [Deltaproteobacteria bacterium]